MVRVSERGIAIDSERFTAGWEGDMMNRKGNGSMKWARSSVSETEER